MKKFEKQNRLQERRKTPVNKKEQPGKSEHPKRRSSISGYKKQEPEKSETKKDTSLVRLNKYIADAGICSRREADKLILAGAVKINGEVVTTLGTKVSRTDKVQFGDQTLSREKLRYLLLNKPKGFITSTNDPHHEKTVMNLLSNACKERIYPIGRLDRNTTGLLLFTNDGQLTKKLSHPRYGIKKIYHVVLDKALTKTDMIQIVDGIELEDGKIKVDAIEYVGDGSDKKELGIELHSGKNRIVRRIFEKLRYHVVKLDRVYFAGLTKKNLARGHWRFLEEKEINMLKMLS
jgi:23S rRNA pseudouridine2605 synthase